MTNILVLAAGHTGFETHNGGYPLCLTEMHGVSLLESIVNNTRGLRGARYAFALREDDIQHFHMDKVVELLAPSATAVRISGVAMGSACTALLAASQLDFDQELLIISANELVDAPLHEVVETFRERKLDAGTLTFPSIHPRYSYVRLDEEDLVVEAAQQNPISHNATAGIFWFAKCGAFIEAVKSMIKKDAHIHGKFYICPAFNELILRQGRVGVYKLDPKRYYPLKTERQVYQFEEGIAA